ncbi:MAG: hypothetical protein JXR14_02505 [Paracoccaceae bacterium]
MILEIPNAVEAVNGRNPESFLPWLRKIREIGLPELDDDQRDVQARIDAYIRWVDDVRPAFTSEQGQEDKFSDLVALARKHTVCLDFLTLEVGVNGSTIWRWAKGKVRPSPYIGRQLVRDIQAHLIRSLVDASYVVGFKVDSDLTTSE